MNKELGRGKRGGFDGSFWTPEGFNPRSDCEVGFSGGVGDFLILKREYHRKNKQFIQSEGFILGFWGVE